MSTITVPARSFHTLRSLVRNKAPQFYGWAVNNTILRGIYGKLKGEVIVQVGHDPKEIFTAIYQHNHWDDGESRSGGGSNLVATRRIRSVIPKLVKELNIRSILDAPCGDFHWFKEMELEIDNYIGGDIVVSLAETNNRKFARPGRSFLALDLVKDPLPDVDLFLCRDCLIHLSNEMVLSALDNLTRSNIKYLLATNYPDCVENIDIAPGEYRPINLALPPFNLPPPVRTIEDYADGFAPRQLALWETGAVAAARSK